MSEQPKPRRGVGTVIGEQLKAGATNEAALAAVKAEFPESSTTLATVSWYRNSLRKADPSIPTAAEARRKSKAAEAPTPAE